MSEQDSRPSVGTPRQAIVAALWLGLVVGLIEGVGWMVIQRFGRLTNLWTQVLWIAPLLNGLLFLALALGLVALGRLVPRKLWWPAAAFVLFAAAAANVVALLFQSFVHPLALLVLVLGFAMVLLRRFRRDEEGALRFFRRTLPWVAVTVVAVLLGVQGYYAVRERMDVAALPEADPALPDVIVVVIDALRADHVSAYGYGRETSPFLDRLAEEGVLFERTLATSPYTLPSHASLLAGLYPYEHGVEWLEFDRFAEGDYPSIAEALRDMGYRTGAFSANPFWFTREQGFGRGFIRFEDFYHSAPDMAYRTVFGKIFEKILMPRLGMEDVPARKRATENTDRALRWIAREDDQPVFAFLNHFDVHDPYLPPQPYRSRFSEREEPGGILNWRLGRGETDLTPEELEGEIEAYDGALAYVDDEIRRLVTEIEARRPDRDLLVIVTSDHGEAFGEHGTYLHGKSLYREEILVPLVIRWPASVPAGVRVIRPVSHASIPATILDLVSGGEAEAFGAPSLVPLWEAAPAESVEWPWPLAEMAQRDWVDPAFPVYHGDLRSVASPAWQYIAYDTLPDELFAWEDVLQEHDRVAEPELRPVVEDFRRWLEARPRDP